MKSVRHNLNLRCGWNSFFVLGPFLHSKLLSVDIKGRKKRPGFPSSHFTLSRKTALSGIPKMPNILNQFQNKRTMTEEYQE